MAPLREYRSLSERYEDEIEIDTLSRYYLIFEGKNTEKKYFKGIQGYRKELGISSLIELIILSKEGEIKDYSSPKKLLDLINQKKEELKSDSNYDENIDKFVIMFDRDSFDKKEEFLKFLELASEDNILTVTSPCFEIWLLLHYEDALEKHIKPHIEKINKNEKISATHSYVSKLCSDISGVNPKRNVNFSKIKDKVDYAINQEKQICQENLIMFDTIGSNVGSLVEEMKKDPRELLY